jgi:lipoprotein-anchoring transpeptidase ErfK/SrfK
MPSQHQRTSRADPEPGKGRRRGRAGSIGRAGPGVAGAAVAAALLIAGCSGGTPQGQGAATPTAHARVADPPPGTTPARTWLVAVAHVPAVHLYRTPEAAGSPSVFPGRSALGVPAVFLVRQDDGAWLDVYVARRPDGSTAWISSSEVSLEKDRYTVLVSLSRHSLTVLDGSRVLVRTPAATGKPATPTPAGTYFITELLRQPGPAGAYGPYAYGLSAFSPALSRFSGGPGQIGLHGTNEPASIGRAVSHGCIRVPNAVIERLARELPLGTPVVIVS